MTRTCTLGVLLNVLVLSLSTAKADPPCVATDYCSPEATFISTQPDDGFGMSVALRGDSAIVGASGDSCDTGSGRCGAAYVYRNSGGWAQEAKLVAADAYSGDRFGSEVAIDVEWAMAAATGVGCAAGSTCGAVYVFRYSGMEWTQVAKLMPFDLQSYDYFGASIALQGHWAAIGSTHGVYLYEFNGVFWNQRQKLPHYFTAIGNQVGMDAERLIVGVPDSRAVFFYKLNAGGWVDDGVVQGLTNDNVGYHVSIDGNDALAYSPQFDCPGVPNCGGFYRYRNVGGVWGLLEVMEIENPQDNEFNINPSDTGIDGDWAVIGRSGYVFHRNPDQTWNQVARLGAAESPVGTPLRMDGGRILIGGVRHDGNPVHVFDLSRVGQDCNCDGSPDSCDVVLYSVGDCQGNGIFDSCDIHDGTSSDCAGDYIPDECQPDCQSNGIEDSCDIAAGSQDCNLNARPDECELSYFDCNQNGRPDDCDTENETLIPNECSCIMTIAPEPEPSGWIKNRFISFVPGNPGHWKAIRVKLVTLHHVDPPYSGGPSIPFTAMEGEVRWVGPPFNYQESSTDSTQFYASKLQCSAEFRDWSTIDVLHVTSSAIVPSSSYEVQIVGANCNLSSSASYSPPLIIETGRWGDVRVPFAATDGSVQPDISDVSALVDKFRSVPGALSKARALLSSGVSTGGLNLVVDVGFDSISAVVDAFRGGPYPFTISSCP